MRKSVWIVASIAALGMLSWSGNATAGVVALVDLS